MLKRGAAWVESVGKVVIQQAAQRSHVDVREPTQASGEVGGVVTCPEDAAKLRVETVLCHHPGTQKSCGKKLICCIKFTCIHVRSSRWGRSKNKTKFYRRIPKLFIKKKNLKKGDIHQSARTLKQRTCKVSYTADAMLAFI